MFLILFARCFTETAEREFGEAAPEEGGHQQQHSQRQRQAEHHKGTPIWESKLTAAHNRWK